MKGILFRPEMVKAVVEDRKTQTRRLSGLKEINKEPDKWRIYPSSDSKYFIAHCDTELHQIYIKPRYKVGEVVYVKEAWATESQFDHLKPRDIPHSAKVFYLLDGYDSSVMGKKRSPLFMPEWAARYFIQIADVRAEKLNNMTEDDAHKEGLPDIANYGTPIQWFMATWDSINPKYPWASNPWCFAYTFRVKSFTC